MYHSAACVADASSEQYGSLTRVFVSDFVQTFFEQVCERVVSKHAKIINVDVRLAAVANQALTQKLTGGRVGFWEAVVVLRCI